MKTLADSLIFDRIETRLFTLTADLQPIWGIMSASRMVAHLDGAFRMAAGELFVQPCPLPFPPLVRFLVLRSGLAWRKNFQTVPELELRHVPEPAEPFPAIRQSLIERMRAFTGLAPLALLAAHPMLGTMSRWEWMRWGYLHTDHHLRQFGC